VIDQTGSVVLRSNADEVVKRHKSVIKGGE